MTVATESVMKLTIKLGGRRIVGADQQVCKSEQQASFPDWRCDGINQTGESKKSGKISAIKGSKLIISVPVSSKRRSHELLNSPKKRLKLDRALKQQCSTLLKKLMNHQCGWPFNQPVDPVALNIPDYFSVISEPMDLGTVKSKLEKNLYHGIEEFATDVRLTFSNAMLYNPPGNDVHRMADQLNKIFESGWKVLEAKWNIGMSKTGFPSMGKKLKDGSSVEHDDSRFTSLVGSESMVADAEDKCDSIPGITRVKVSKLFRSKSLNDANKGLEHNQASHFDGSDLANSMLASPLGTSDQDCDGTGNAVDGEGPCATEVVDAAAGASCGDGWADPLPDIHLSPKKALRAAILKSRFAATILKAQHKTLLDHGDKSDPIKLQQEKERLEQKQLEEKVRIEAQIKAAEVRAEAELKKQRERDREAARIALQKMEKSVEIGENLHILKELEILTGGSLSVNVMESDDGSEVLSGGLDGTPGKSPLEQLGLFMKDDYVEEDDDDETVCNVGEDGEIIF
ncbi:hypothetical protein SAY86_000271 [Trapa natans]|uniref:Bromo domain-containing protein n=1 Tax=Trapa natans TaxID=22666 RepID=A0AAN7RMQ9_TRANT|nr:hypothetical protein SAY86_000271 [Trapa natans]